MACRLTLELLLGSQTEWVRAACARLRSAFPELKEVSLSDLALGNGARRGLRQPIALVDLRPEAHDLEPLRALRATLPGTPVVVALGADDFEERLASLPRELDYYPLVDPLPDEVPALVRSIAMRRCIPAPLFAAGRESEEALEELRRSHRAFAELHGITADTLHSFQERLKEVLRLGLRYFGLTMAIVSHIEESRYTIVESVAADGPGLAPGTVFPLAETYCERTFAARIPLGFEHAAVSEWHKHPCYRSFRLEAYIGVPISVGDEAFGTLNFSSPTPVRDVFRPLNVALLKVMGQWVGAELLRQRHEESLRRVNAELEEFAYAASHDLKAPLRAVANLALCIDEDTGEQLDAENRERLRLLRDRVMQMDRLIDALLEFSRVSHGKAAPHAPVDPEPLIAEVLEETPPPAGFRVEVASPLPRPAVKPLHLKQIVRNLIGNAIRHHDRSDGHIRISGQETEELCELDVADDGPGIPPHKRESIFRVFVKLGAQKVADQTGIGLALVRKLVSGYGGRIEIDDNRPRGSVFRIILPKPPEPP